MNNPKPENDTCVGEYTMKTKTLMDCWAKAISKNPIQKVSTNKHY